MFFADETVMDAASYIEFVNNEGEGTTADTLGDPTPTPEAEQPKAKATKKPRKPKAPKVEQAKPDLKAMQAEEQKAAQAKIDAAKAKHVEEQAKADAAIKARNAALEEAAKQPTAQQAVKVLKKAKAKGVKLEKPKAEPKAAPAPEPVKKMVPKGTNARRKLIKAALTDLPTVFEIVDWAGHKARIGTLEEGSTADLKTEKVTLVVIACETKTAMGAYSPGALKALITKVHSGKLKGGKKPSKGKAPKSKKPHVKGERKSESNIPMMRRLLLEGKTQEEIFTAYVERYTEQGVPHKTESWTWDRVAIYHKIAFGGMNKEDRAKVKTTEIVKPGKAEPKAKKGKPTKGKKKADKAPKEKGEAQPPTPKPDGVSKAARKAKQAAKKATVDAVAQSEIGAAEEKLKAMQATKDVKLIVAAKRELEETKAKHAPCVMCDGGTKKLKNPCAACNGTGKGGK